MAAYDVYGAFERMPQITGMELTRRGDHWEGGYYLNGDLHDRRRDKIKVVKWNNDIWVHEEGGESMPIAKWMETYGRATGYWDAVRILRGDGMPIAYDEHRVREKVIETQYVGADVMRGATGYDLGMCPLFRWMSALFGEAVVRGVWERYNVTTDAHGNAVFWYVDGKGRICHDKRMAYKEDGHRDRDMGAWRRYTMGKGYNGKCLFGEHLMAGQEHVYVVESEKTALIAAAYYNKVFVATGGKNALTEKDERLMLVPDMDAIDEWRAKGQVWEWWTKFQVVDNHWDIGDAIVKRKENIL